MTVVMPDGYLTILQAADVLLPAMHGGILDRPVVSQLRNQGLDVKDGQARNQAIAEIWKAVDAGTLRALAIGGRPCQIRIMRLDDTKSIPMLRSPRGRGFTSLRQSNPAHHQLAVWFGPLVYSAILGFREQEIQKLAGRLMRARRAAQKSDSQKTSRGRPSRITEVQATISDLIDRQKWNVTMTLKALTRDVNRVGKWSQPVSKDTVTRALDLLHGETKERRFERIRRVRRPRRK
jgi:hypothetical protein